MGEIQNLVLLALCWACTLSSSTLLTSIGPLTAEQVGAPESLAPLAVACFLFGAAITYDNVNESSKLERRTRTNKSSPHAFGPCLTLALASQVGALGLEIFRRCGRRGGFLLSGAPLRFKVSSHEFRTRILGPLFNAGDNRSTNQQEPRSKCTRNLQKPAALPYPKAPSGLR